MRFSHDPPDEVQRGRVGDFLDCPVGARRVILVHMRPFVILWGVVTVWGAGVVEAGMPPPPPLLEYAKPAKEIPSSPTASAAAAPPTAVDDDDEETWTMRLRVVSFFIAAFAVSAWGVRFLWNSLQRDFPTLPRVGYPRALAATALWGLLFVLVLTMISGARELMTPGAWVRNGLTYKLADAEPAPVTKGAADAGPLANASESVRFAEAVRRKALLDLHEALKQREGGYPSTQFGEDYDFPAKLWLLPDGSGARYVYLPVPGVTRGRRPLAYEPAEIDGGRMVLFLGGEVVRMTSAELKAALEKEGK